MCVCACTWLYGQTSSAPTPVDSISAQLQCCFCYCAASPLILLRAAADFDKATSQPVSRLSLLRLRNLNWTDASASNTCLHSFLCSYTDPSSVLLWWPKYVCFHFPSCFNITHVFKSNFITAALKVPEVPLSELIKFFWFLLLLCNSGCSITDWPTSVADSISSNTDSPLSNPICVYDATRTVMFHQSL